MRAISTPHSSAFLDKGGLAMRKHNILIWLLVCLLLLLNGALAAGVMDVGERMETPLGEETPLLPNAPGTAASAPVSARLSDAGHTAADHAAWTPLSAAGTLQSGSYYLTGDVTGNLVIEANATVDLCLDGHTLDAAGSGSVITVNTGATLNLYDCFGGGKVTGGNASLGGGVNIAGGTLNLYGGTISDNTSAGNTGLVQGGGVYVGADSVFQMYAGQIFGNTVQGKGSAILQSFGSGVYVAGGTFRMSGGSITGNTGKGGGVYLSAGGVFELFGSPVIKENTLTTGASANVVLPKDQKITITGALDASASIGVTMNAPGIFTTGTAVVNANYAANFFSDTANRSPCAVGGQLSMGAQLTYAKPDGLSGTAPVDSNVYAVGDTVSVDTTLPLSKRGYQQIGWTNSLGGSEPVTTLVIERNTTLYPIFDRFVVTYAVPDGVSGAAPVDSTGYSLGDTVTLDTTCPLTKQGYRQIGWTNSTSSATAKSTITITGDVTLFPVFARSFEAVGNDTFSLTYATPMNELDLNELIQFSQGVTDTSKDFLFTLASDQTLPAGLRLEDTGRIGGTPTAAPGSYSVTFDVKDRRAATLFGLSPASATDTAALTLTFNVAPATPTAADFVFTPPADLGYDGAAKAASVTVKNGVTGMGAITVKYSAIPVAKGTYTVSIDVAEGENYQAVTGLTDPSWVFSIEGIAKVALGALQWANGQTTIALTPTPADLLTGTQVIAARYDANGAMTDLAWGTLSGTTVTFSGKQLTANSGWKFFFLSGSSAPCCPAVELK